MLIFLSVGALPTLNALAAGLWVGIHYPASRWFVLGFEAFGAAALLFLAVGTLSERPPAFLAICIGAWIGPVYDAWPLGENRTILREIGAILRAFDQGHIAGTGVCHRWRPIDLATTAPR